MELNANENTTYDIKDVEIFKVGKWNGDEYTNKDLDNMVKAFDQLKDRIMSRKELKVCHVFTHVEPFNFE